MTGPWVCEGCNSTGVIHVKGDTYRKCSCLEAKMAVNLVLDKCCAILNMELCDTPSNLDRYTVRWDQDVHCWTFDLKIRGRAPEAIQIGHRETLEYGDAMVGTFAQIFQRLMR